MQRLEWRSISVFFLPEVVFQHPQAGALVEMVWLWSLLEEDTIHPPLERTQSPQHTVGYKTKIKDKRKLSQASRKCNQISIQSVMAWLQAGRHEISLFQACNHSREIPITAKHKSILVTRTWSASSPEEDCICRNILTYLIAKENGNLRESDGKWARNPEI